MAKKETTKKLKEQKKQLEKNKKNKKDVPLKPGDPGYSTAGANGETTTTTMSITETTIDRSQLTADQLAQAQLEEAIKESQDPSARLKKLRSPFNVRSCLLNILILVVLTVAIVLFCCWLLLDKETFKLGVVIKDIFDKFGITKFFRAIGRWFKKVF